MENVEVFLPRRKVCDQSSWVSSSCVSDAAELAGKGGAAACWEGPGRFLHSRDLLLNRSRADVAEELMEIQLRVLQLWVEAKKTGVHWGQLRSKGMSSSGYKESHC